MSRSRLETVVNEWRIFIHCGIPAARWCSFVTQSADSPSSFHHTQIIISLTFHSGWMDPFRNRFPGNWNWIEVFRAFSSVQWLCLSFQTEQIKEELAEWATQVGPWRHDWHATFFVDPLTISLEIPISAHSRPCDISLIGDGGQRSRGSRDVSTTVSLTRA